MYRNITVLLTVNSVSDHSSRSAFFDGQTKWLKSFTGNDDVSYVCKYA